MLYEKGASTTEIDGPPCFFAYAPQAAMKFRAESIEAVHRMITMCYNAESDIGRKLHGKFWALIESINGGGIPKQCFLQLQQRLSLEMATGYNRDTFLHGLASAPYRTGVGKFAAHFKPDEPYSAIIAVEKGVHGEHGVGIFFEQSTRRCLLTQRILPKTDEKTFWKVMRMWANFDPRPARQRKDAGQLYYPAQYSHMFELHWDFIHAPTQEAALDKYMSKYASAAAQLEFTKDALVDAEAPEKSLKIASSGAMSRRYPVQDAQDYFSSLQEQAQEECDTVANGFPPGPDVHNVDAGPGDSVT
jgi:hypothetical protein